MSCIGIRLLFSVWSNKDDEFLRGYEGSRHIKNTYHQHDFSLMILTRSLAGEGVCVFPPVSLLFFFFILSSFLFGSKSPLYPIREDGESYSPSWRAEYLCKSLASLPHDRSVCSSKLLIKPIKWSHGSFSYVLAYNPILLYFLLKLFHL